MTVRHVCGASTVAMLTLATAVFAQGSQSTPTSTTTSSTQAGSGSQSESPITLVGCIQRETEYRSAQDAGRGGVAATGLGLGNEFVLINAMVAGTSSASDAAADCSNATGGEAYELTGSGERDLEQYVGHRVEVSGMLKHSNSDAAIGTSGAASATERPSGGFDPLGQDLRLREVNVTSVREYAAAQVPTQGEPAPLADAPQPRRPAPADPGISPQIELPTTASPIPLTGLAGLLSLCGAAGIRAYRRRR
jgi:MYXO-CTERM domain-containing protein